MNESIESLTVALYELFKASQADYNGEKALNYIDLRNAEETLKNAGFLKSCKHCGRFTKADVLDANKVLSYGVEICDPCADKQDEMIDSNRQDI